MNSVLFHPIEISWFLLQLCLLFYGELQVVVQVFLKNDKLNGEKLKAKTSF